MGFVAAGAALAGAAISAYGSIKEGQDSAEQARRNQALANLSAADAIQKGARDAGAIRTQGSQLVAQQHLAYANSGIDATSGTPADVMASSRMMAELDAQTAKNNAARTAWGYKTQGLEYAQQAALNQTAASNRAAGTILGGIGQAASYYRPAPKRPPEPNPPPAQDPRRTP